jgi:uncharacterized protein HemY
LWGRASARLFAEKRRMNALIGKSYYMNRDYKKSTAYLERAVAEEPSNSSFYDWLGKAFGRRPPIGG